MGCRYKENGDFHCSNYSIFNGYKLKYFAIYSVRIRSQFILRTGLIVNRCMDDVKNVYRLFAHAQFKPAGIRENTEIFCLVLMVYIAGTNLAMFHEKCWKMKNVNPFCSLLGCLPFIAFPELCIIYLRGLQKFAFSSYWKIFVKLIFSVLLIFLEFRETRNWYFAIFVCCQLEQ